MPIDPNIALSIRPPQIENPLNAMLRVQQLRRGQQEEQLNALRMQQAQQQAQDAPHLHAQKVVESFFQNALGPISNLPPDQQEAAYNAGIQQVAAMGGDTSLMPPWQKIAPMAAAYGAPAPMTAAQDAANALGRDKLNAYKERTTELANRPPEARTPLAVIGPDGNPVYVSQQNAIGQRPAPTGSESFYTPEQTNLLGAMGLDGVALPAGFRSREQMRATVQGIINKTPDMTDEERVSVIRSGQIGFGAEKKETTTAANMAGRVSVAVEELGQMGPVALRVSAKVPRGKFIPISQLLQMADTSLSDPQLVQLKIATNSLLNAYDMLAARGGTDIEKRKQTRSLLTSAQSPEAYAAGVQMFQREADVARTAAEKAMLPRSKRDGSATGPAPGTVEDGYRFKGGDPADPNSWEPAQ